MRFWDTSAIIPLLVKEDTTDHYRKLLEEDANIIVWYGTVVEIESTLCRRKREETVTPSQLTEVRQNLNILQQSWMEVVACEAVRNRAVRLLRVHALRAADALQLAAALIVCEEQPNGFGFLTGDKRLAEAATAESFQVI